MRLTLRRLWCRLRYGHQPHTHLGAVGDEEARYRCNRCGFEGGGS